MAKRGRPPENNVKRNMGFRVRLTPSEWADWVECADEDGKSISKEIRDLVQKRLEEQAEERKERRQAREAWYREHGYITPEERVEAEEPYDIEKRYYESFNDDE